MTNDNVTPDPDASAEPTERDLAEAATLKLHEQLMRNILALADVEDAPLTDLDRIDFLELWSTMRDATALLAKITKRGLEALK